MKGFRLIALIGALVALGAPAVHAQGGGGGPGRGPGRQMEMLMQDITLTDVQKTKVDSIVQAYRAQMPAFTRGQPLDSAARAKRMEVMQQQNTAIRAMLTPEQQTTFDKNIETMRQNMGGRPRP